MINLKINENVLRKFLVKKNDFKKKHYDWLKINENDLRLRLCKFYVKKEKKKIMSDWKLNVIYYKGWFFFQLFNWFQLFSSDLFHQKLQDMVISGQK